MKNKICITCGSIFQSRHSKSFLCSTGCSAIYRGKNRTKSISWNLNNDGCWVCNSHPINRGGYPQIRSYGSPRMSVSRYIYEECFGVLEKGLVVRHKCDNRLCINPEHLESGTIADNNKDKMIRGRFKPVRGEQNPRSILKESDVLSIRSLMESGCKRSSIAKQFKVSPRTIDFIVQRRNWAWL